MRNRIVILLLTCAFLSFECAVFGQNNQGQNGQGGDSQGQNSQGDQENPGVPGASVFWAKGRGPANKAARPNSSPNLLWNGGNIMPTVSDIQPIFWGSSWGDSKFVNDKILGLADFYTGMSNSSYAQTADEYHDSQNLVTPSITYYRPLFDSSLAASGSQTSPILSEVCKVITTPAKDGYGYYSVYVDRPRGSAGYCAWHSAGFCGGVPVQFAFFFNLDGDPGCDPQDTSGLHSQGLAALANVSGHEISEARTDPRLNAWFDRSGNENADKCAWSFGHRLLTAFSNGSQWKIQGNWSNQAYLAGTGYPNLSGQKGCIDGGGVN